MSDETTGAAGTFQYFDETFTFSDELDQFAVTEFAEAMDDGVEAAGLRGIAVAWRLALGCVHPDDQDRFRRLSRKNKAGADKYLAVFRDRLAADAERPTGQPTDSSRGQDSTSPTSAPADEASVTPLKRTDAKPPVPAGGRPDLKVAAARAHRSA